jgi:hypothetical protein
VTARPVSKRAFDQRQEELARTVVLVAAGLVSLPALVGGCALCRLVSRARWVWAGAALVGLGVVVLLRNDFASELHAAATAVTRPGSAADPRPKLEAGWPHLRALWLLSLPLAPLYALVIDAAPAIPSGRPISRAAGSGPLGA